jgi:alkylation response protein AidB-like acyl-CoA dehydrogenase
LRIFGNSITKEFDGGELDSTGVSRILEALSIYPNIGINLIYNNEIVAKSLLMYGNEKQKNKYLRKLTEGNLIGGFCFSELNNGLDTSRFTCKSSILYDGSNISKFILNGKKSWVCLLADETDADFIKTDTLFLVVSKTVNFNELDEPLREAGINLADTENLKKIATEKDLNAFLIPANTKGVIIKKQHSSNSGLNLYEIEFNNVEVDSSSLLGNVNDGFEISSTIIERNHYLVGAICLGLLKNLLKETVSFAINSIRFGKPLSEHLSVKEKIANIEGKIYAMESNIVFFSLT